jgi:hypothetical protein
MEAVVLGAGPVTADRGINQSLTNQLTAGNPSAYECQIGRPRVIQCTAVSDWPLTRQGLK